MEHGAFEFKTEGRALEVLIACEESQEVTKAFRELGHNAWSCDLQPCSGGKPEWHIQKDVRIVLDNKKFDLVIAHPPCTRLSNSGVRWLAERDLWADMYSACEFFNLFQRLGDTAVAIENPIPHKYAVEYIKKYTQIIQPWMFGHHESKATCLWLYNLPKLQPTNIVEGREQRIWKLPPSQDRAKLRSKTYSGIAQAMALQWSSYLCGGVLNSNALPLNELQST